MVKAEKVGFGTSAVRKTLEASRPIVSSDPEHQDGQLQTLTDIKLDSPACVGFEA